jgi:NAD(P)H dehydrogenase (quinone)
MNILIVYAHPNEKSFNRGVLEAVSAGLNEAGHTIKVKDLYAENFDPVLTADDLAALQQGNTPEHIQREQDMLSWADGLVFIYPLWWFGRPAILKGWFDTVLTNGFAFSFSDKGLTGLLKHKKALVLITAGGQKEYFVENDAESLLHRPMTDGTLSFCGIEKIEHQVYYNIPASTDEERQTILDEVRLLGKNY